MSVRSKARSKESGTARLPDELAPIAAALDALIAANLGSEASRLLERFGLALIRSGRARDVERWESALGRDSASPASLLLHARALAERNAPDAFAKFVDAHAAAVSAGDATCEISAAAGALLNLFSVSSDFHPLPVLLTSAEKALDPQCAPADATSRCEALSGVMAGWLLQRPDHPDMSQLAESLFAFVGNADGDATVDPGTRLVTGGVLLGYCQVHNEIDRGEAVIGALDALAATGGVAIGRRIEWEYEAALYLLLSQDADVERCRQRVAAHLAGMPDDVDAYYRFGASRLEYELARAADDVDAAEAAIERARGLVNPALPAQAISVAFIEAKLALALADYKRARAVAKDAVDLADRVGVPDIINRVYRQYLVQASAYSGYPDEARAQLAILMRGATGRHLLSYEVTRGVIDVAEAFAGPGEHGDAQRDNAVRNCLAAVERSAVFRVFGAARPLGARVMAHALERNIHPVTARKVIAAMHLAPPPYRPENWPWVMRLRLLGAERIEIGGRPLGGKLRAQQRPLDLLYAIALEIGAKHAEPRRGPGPRNARASGPDGTRPVDAEQLMRVLWPDADADPKASFDVTLSRLRKLLGHDAMVTLSNGELRLDRSRIWCDVWEFSALVADEPVPAAAIERMMQLHAGPLFGSISEHSAPAWALATRERLRNLFLRALEASGAQAEREHRWTDAIGLYERGIDQDPLAESFYRGLISAHLALGAPANALRAYRRCRDMLAQALGTQPSAETEALRRTIA